MHSAVFLGVFPAFPPHFIYSLVAALLITTSLGTTFLAFNGHAIDYEIDDELNLRFVIVTLIIHWLRTKLEAMISRLDLSPSFPCDLESTH